MRDIHKSANLKEKRKQEMKEGTERAPGVGLF